MTKGYVKDFFGKDTKMRSWIFDNGIDFLFCVLFP